MEGSLHSENQLDSSSRFDTIPACDGRTDRRTHDDSEYRALRAKSEGAGDQAACVRGSSLSLKTKGKPRILSTTLDHDRVRR